MRVRRPDDDHIDVQMAPLIDVVFLLLIFFMLTMAVRKPDVREGTAAPLELALELPHSGAAVASSAPTDTLVLAVDKNGNKYAGVQQLSTQALHNIVKAAAARNPNQKVRIDADRSAKYEDVIEVIELCQFEGLRNVGLHTAPTPPTVTREGMPNATR